MTKPTKTEETNRFIVHEHIRGNSSHIDLRFEVNNHLIGFTLDDPGKINEPLRLRNDTEYSDSNKILCQPKQNHPKEWLTVEGKIEPGEIGTTKFLPAKFKILDSGTYSTGVQTQNMLEVFLSGKTYKGRFLFKKLPKKQNSDELAEKQDLAWFCWKPINQSPYVLSSKAMELNWSPPQGMSAMPKEWQDKIPAALKWWEKNWTGIKAEAAIKEIRKTLLKRNILTLSNIQDFTLSSFNEKLNPEKKYWNLELSTGLRLTLDKNPLEHKTGINAIKNIEQAIEIINIKDKDKGKIQILESNDKFMSLKFQGNRLKGFWTARKTENNWILETLQTDTKSKKIQNTKLTEWQIGSIVNLSNDSELSLSDIANNICASKSSVKYWQKKLGLK